MDKAEGKFEPKEVIERFFAIFVLLPKNSIHTSSMFKNNFLKLKADRTWLHVFFFLVSAFLISSLSLLLGYLLKKVNPAEYGFIRGNKQDLELTYKEILFFASIVVTFFLLSLSFRYVKKRTLKLFLVYFSLFYLFAAGLIILADCIYYIIFSYRLTFSVVQTILNTNPEEVKGFIKLYTSPGNIAALVVFSVSLAVIIYKRACFVGLLSTRMFFITSLVLSCLGALDFMQTAHSKGNGPHNVRYWDIIIGEYNEYNEFNRRLEVERNANTLSKEYGEFYVRDTLPKTLVFIISESLSKNHMSLYGYSRRTTPHLDTNRSIVTFNNCVTQAALTIEAVPGLFFNGHLSKKINLIALLNKLGYETSWISNQSGWGKGDRSIVLLSQISKTSVFTDARADNDIANSSIHFDEDIIGEFDKALSRPSKKSKFIVLHFMGCHFDYEKRYPVQKSVYTSRSPANIKVNTDKTQKIINTYDNAMLYHDSVVNEVVKVFTKYSKHKNAALVFLSDHGEELYEYRDYAGHGYPPSRAMAEIPYFAMVSNDFKKNYPALTDIMERRKNTSYSTVNNFYTLINLLNINSKKHQEKILKNAFFSPQYDSMQARFVMGNDYEKMN